MVHERFDIGRFRKMFPLAKAREKVRRSVRKWLREELRRTPTTKELQARYESHAPGGHWITSPYHIAIAEQIRDEQSARLRGVKRVPADVFLWARGEPKDRRATKIGGVPYWPRRRRWPQAPRGRPMRFVAQFCFMDSRRLFERLPGDVLLIFARDVEHIWEKDLRCEWVDGHETDLVDPTATPHIQRLVPLYGVLHRTHDYADQADEVFYAYPSWYNLPRLQATKIGGLPGWIQGEPDRAGGRFLCELTSIQPEPDTPYPYVNVAAPQPFFSEERERLLMFGDVGSAYLLLGRNARLKWVIQDY